MVLKRSFGARVSALAAVVAGSLILAATAQAAFPGANGKIAFHEFPGGDDGEIGVINPDGTGRQQLTNNGVTINDFNPAWSADGTRIVWSRDDGSTSAIWVMNADGTGQTPLTSGHFDTDPYFFPDGRIVFARSNATLNEIWVMNADGTGQTPLTSGQSDIEPTVSPNGQLIAFARSAMDGDFDLYTMNAGGGAVTPLTVDAGNNDRAPNFTPDGAKVVFDRCVVMSNVCMAGSNLASVGAGGGGVTLITDNSQEAFPVDTDPANAPDGTRIVFERAVAPMEFELRFVGSGGGATQFLIPVGFNPDWGPLAAAGGLCFGEPATILGTNGRDKLSGTPDRDVIQGFNGNDDIKGKGGEDIICGSRGKDRLFGGRGGDILVGGSGSDFLKGGPGKDQLFGGSKGFGKNDKKKSASDTCVAGELDLTNNCLVLRPKSD